MLSEHEVEEFISKYVKNEMVLGIGSNPAGELFLKKLALRKEQEKLSIKVIPTSMHMASLLSQLHLPLADLNEDEIDLAIEFVDLADNDYNFVKRDSASFVRDKMISQGANELIIVLEKKNLAKDLHGLIPFEVVPFGWKRTLMQLETYGRASIRKKGFSLFKTESGNHVVDVQVDEIFDLHEFELKSKDIPGVIETGLFLGYADRIVLVNDKIEVKSRMR